MLASIERINRFTEGMSVQEFLSDEVMPPLPKSYRSGLYPNEGSPDAPSQKPLFLHIIKEP